MKDEYDFSAGKRGPVLKRPGQRGESRADLPVVCTLTRATIATREAALLPGLFGRADSREDTAEGIRIRLPADALSAVLETVDAERQCCRFLRFEITVEPDGGPIWLTLSGPPGTREFLSALLES
ncbi:MAG: hypothetical protein DMF94_26450 [Acidobacteria bacterium]|nr:MAG: hypothetical protein DMF96_25035 [Acidobacteriota bacterium]PYR16772.1 MAG: hypothetical protein DMF94_26450 [Acidobacteriota bacterium]